MKDWNSDRKGVGKKQFKQIEICVVIPIPRSQSRIQDFRIRPIYNRFFFSESRDAQGLSVGFNWFLLTEVGSELKLVVV
jgi:hypothetical protein